MTAALHPDIRMAIDRGLHLLPVKPKDKIPLLTDWPNRATSDEATVREWFEKFPGRNVGIATGLISGVIVLDVDPRHGGDETLASLPELPATWTCHTGGGRHHYFRHPGIGPVNNSAGVVGPGLDIRGDGGFVVAPPSVHANGRPYAWDVDQHPDEVALANLPDWIMAKIDRPLVAAVATPPAEWRGRVAEEVPEGRRTTRLAQLAGHLLRRHVDPYVALELLQGWNIAKCKPPIGGEELQTTVANIVKRELSRRQEGEHAA